MGRGSREGHSVADLHSAAQTVLEPSLQGLAEHHDGEWTDRAFWAPTLRSPWAIIRCLAPEWLALGEASSARRVIALPITRGGLCAMAKRAPSRSPNPLQRDRTAEAC